MKLRHAALALTATATLLSGCGSAQYGGAPTNSPGPAAVGASTALSPNSTSRPRPMATKAEVLYLVRGTATSADLTMKTPTGTSQQSDIAVPLETKSGKTGLEYQFDYGEFVYISAQNKDKSGTISCVIQVDGIAVSTNQSSGAYAIATCDGST